MPFIVPGGISSYPKTSLGTIVDEGSVEVSTNGELYYIYTLTAEGDIELSEPEFDDDDATIELRVYVNDSLAHNIGKNGSWEWGTEGSDQPIKSTNLQLPALDAGYVDATEGARTGGWHSIFISKRVEGAKTVYYFKVLSPEGIL